MLFSVLYFLDDRLDIVVKVVSLVLVVFVISYAVILYFVQRFIFRKIKLIYKSIRRVRRDAQGQDTSVDVDADIFSEVEREVMHWKREQDSEMDEMKHLEEYRKAYVGNVAHELRTPIFNIQGYLHTLLEEGVDDEDIRLKYLSKACENIDRLNVIIEGLDVINRMESGMMILEMQKISIKDLVVDVFAELELKAQEKGVSLLFKDKASKSYDVIADKNALRQVLVNILINSLKYGRKGGRTLVSFYDMHSYVLVEISDTGIGIEKQHLKHLFDRFYRVDRARSRSEGGSGLGLSIAKHIIEAHNETITVRSTPEVGTTFGFTLKKA